MVLGKHAVALLAHLAHALGIGGGQVKVGRLPPGQEGQLFGRDLCRVQQGIQGQAAQLLQEGQLVVQCSLQNRGQGTGSGLPHADRLGLQHSGAQVLAPICGALKQCCFKLGHGVTHRTHAPAPGLHTVGQVQQFSQHRVLQQGAEDHQPVEPGVPFFQFHSPIPLPCFSFLFCCAKKSVSR